MILSQEQEDIRNDLEEVESDLTEIAQRMAGGEWTTRLADFIGSVSRKLHKVSMAMDDNVRRGGTT